MRVLLTITLIDHLVRIPLALSLIDHLMRAMYTHSHLMRSRNVRNSSASPEERSDLDLVSLIHDF